MICFACFFFVTKSNLFLSNRCFTQRDDDVVVVDAFHQENVALAAMLEHDRVGLIFAGRTDPNLTSRTQVVVHFDGPPHRHCDCQIFAADLLTIKAHQALFTFTAENRPFVYLAFKFVWPFNCGRLLVIHRKGLCVFNLEKRPGSASSFLLTFLFWLSIGSFQTKVR